MSSFVFSFFSQQGFKTANGGRPGAAKVLVVVTDGESHDQDFRAEVIPECEKQGITRFGIAVHPLSFTNFIVTLLLGGLISLCWSGFRTVAWHFQSCQRI